MTAAELAALVKTMRDAQKEYFRHRGNLHECKRLEAQVDRACKEVVDGPSIPLASQQDLFGQEPRSAMSAGR